MSDDDNKNDSTFSSMLSEMRRRAELQAMSSRRNHQAAAADTPSRQHQDPNHIDSDDTTPAPLVLPPLNAFLTSLSLPFYNGTSTSTFTTTTTSPMTRCVLAAILQLHAWAVQVFPPPAIWPSWMRWHLLMAVTWNHCDGMVCIIVFSLLISIRVVVTAKLTLLLHFCFYPMWDADCGNLLWWQPAELHLKGYTFFTAQQVTRPIFWMD